MKIKLAFCMLLAVAIVVSCKTNNDKRKSFSDVVEYNDYLIDKVDEINNVYTRALDTTLSFEDAMKVCDSLVTLCERTTEEVKGIQPFEGDSSMAMQVLQYTQFMRLNGEKHVKDFLKVEEKYMQSADLSVEESDALYEEADERINKLNDSRDKEMLKIDAVQGKFADKFDMMVLE